AGLAAVAVGAVGEDATAAKTVLDQLRIHVRIDQVRRRGDLRARLARVQVAARVGRSRVELQGRKRKVVKLGHGTYHSAFRATVQGLARCSVGSFRVPVADLWFDDTFFQMLDKDAAGNRAGAEGGEVARLLLAVDHLDAVPAQEMDEVGEGDLGAVRHAGE